MIQYHKWMIQSPEKKVRKHGEFSKLFARL